MGTSAKDSGFTGFSVFFCARSRDAWADVPADADCCFFPVVAGAAPGAVFFLREWERCDAVEPAIEGSDLILFAGGGIAGFASAANPNQLAIFDFMVANKLCLFSGLSTLVISESFTFTGKNVVFLLPPVCVDGNVVALRVPVLNQSAYNGKQTVNYEQFIITFFFFKR